MTVVRSRSWRAQLTRDVSLARLKQFDCKFVDDSSLSLTEVARNATSDRSRSVQSRSYDVMYCSTKPRHGEGRLLQRYARVFATFIQENILAADLMQ